MKKEIGWSRKSVTDKTRKKQPIASAAHDQARLIAPAGRLDMPSQIRTLPFAHPIRAEVEAAFGFGPFQMIDHDGLAHAGGCYWNVDDRVENYGGESVLGWKILFWPDLFAVAVHHAVWLKPKSGRLVDITEKVPSDTEPRTTFVADDGLPVNDLTRAPFIADRYHLLSMCPEVHEFVAAERARIAHQRTLADRLFAAGATWRPRGGYEINEKLLEQFKPAFLVSKQLNLRVEAAIEACNRLDVTV